MIPAAPRLVEYVDLLALLLMCPLLATVGRAQGTATVDAPPLPPFAGVLVNADRLGALVVYCTSPGTPPVDAVASRGTRIWLLNREVLEEVRSTENLCDPAISPLKDRFAAVSPTALWLFSIPPDQGTMVSGAVSEASTAGATGDSAKTSYARPRWSPDGRFISVVTSSVDSTRVEVLSVETGHVVATSATGTTSVTWSTDASRVWLGDAVVLLP